MRFPNEEEKIQSKTCTKRLTILLLSHQNYSTENKLEVYTEVKLYQALE